MNTFCLTTGPGASTQIWQKIFGSQDEIWEAEFNASCVDKAKEKHQFDRIKTVTGDQESATVLEGWVQTTGGNFDIIIDDGK